ncbi:MAG: hypothetical protein HC929_17325, partial [Leptolyngbyaceae cyanobacterium SM2_5_2]|nr:hypothetical protein [Leptolyngbyaceae cyanobacterium SM2_5_2]
PSRDSDTSDYGSDDDSETSFEKPWRNKGDKRKGKGKGKRKRDDVSDDPAVNQSPPVLADVRRGSSGKRLLLLDGFTITADAAGTAYRPMSYLAGRLRHHADGGRQRHGCASRVSRQSTLS